MESHLQLILTATTIFVVFLISNHLLKKKNGTVFMPINWPLVGMLPHLLFNVHRFHDWSIGILRRSNGTFLFKGPWFTSMEIVFTTDPSNVHYVMSKNFANFPKGDEFNQIFDILGDGIFNADFELWTYQRNVAHSFLTHPSFRRFLVKTVATKVEKGLIPILESGCNSGRVLDMEDLLQRLTFDTICMLVTGNDPSCLSVDLPPAPFCKALDDAEEVLFLRHAVPKTIWKLQRWLKIGSERRLIRARQVLDGFIYDALTIKRKEMSKNKSSEVLRNGNKIEYDEALDLLTLYMQDNDDSKEFRFNDKFLRDMFLNLLIAGRDTTSAALTWFFWLIHKNPRVETKIQQELESIATKGNFEIEDVCKLVYLHAALCETLRLYPPVPLEHKSPLEPDVLPTGHHVSTTTKIIFSLYAMGRTESIWGEDCSEFKPERWITESGRIKHMPSYKFLAFNAGPRTCLGKEMAFLQMKAVAASVLVNGYRLQLIEEDKVEPDISIILHTKHGLKVKVIKTYC